MQWGQETKEKIAHILEKDDQTKFKYLAIDVLLIYHMLEDETLRQHQKSYRIKQIMLNYCTPEELDSEFNALMSDRFNEVENTANESVKSFSYFKDMDLLIAYGFDFETGSWFEFLGFIDKITSEETALSKRIGFRSYKKDNTKDYKAYENKVHQYNQKMKRRYAFEQEETSNLDSFFESIRKRALKNEENKT